MRVNLKEYLDYKKIPKEAKPKKKLCNISYWKISEKLVYPIILA